MSNTMVIRVFWHLIPPSSLVFRLIHMASSVQPVKQQGMLPVATNRAINNYQRLTAFKLEMMATSPPKPKPTAKRLMSPCQFDNSGTDPTFRGETLQIKFQDNPINRSALQSSQQKQQQTENQNCQPRSQDAPAWQRRNR